MRKAESCAPPGREVEESRQSCGKAAGSSPVRLQRTWFTHYFFNEHKQTVEFGIPEVLCVEAQGMINRMSTFSAIAKYVRVPHIRIGFGLEANQGYGCHRLRLFETLAGA